MRSTSSGQDFPRRSPRRRCSEVLDPEQNSKFQDHYLELDYDLVRRDVRHHGQLARPCAAAVLDRMEIIRLEGYTEDEKVQIAKRHLIPKQIEAHGLTDRRGRIYRRCGRCAIDLATTPAKPAFGTLERELAKIARKALRQILEGKTEQVFANRRKYR